MKYYKVFKNVPPPENLLEGEEHIPEFTVVSEDKLAAMQSNPKLDITIGDECDVNGRTPAEAAAFNAQMAAEKRANR